MNRVAVRIVKRNHTYHVIGRRTTIVCTTFDEAWRESLPYFAGSKW